MFVYTRETNQIAYIISLLQSLKRDEVMISVRFKVAV